MAGIDRPGAAGDQHQEGRLRALQMEGHLEVAVGREIIEVLEGRKPWIDAQLLWSLVHPQIVGAYDILGGERLAVMPLDAPTQLEGESHAVLAPRPPGREFGDDRLEAGVFNVLVKQRQIIEHPHHRPDGEDGGFLQGRHAGRAVRRVDLQNASGLLCQGGIDGTRASQKPND
jgi:hypothetical protein